MIRKLAKGLAAGPFAEPVMGFTMFMVGVALMLPAHTFDLNSYAMLAMIASEEVWGAIMIVLGAFQIWAGLAERRTERLAACMSSGALWVFWTTGTYISGSQGTLWAIGIAMIVGQGLAYLRAAVKIS
jgi:hypothetical protein